MLVNLEEVGQIFPKLLAFVVLRVPVLVVRPRLSHRRLLPLVTLILDQPVRDGVAGGGKAAARCSSEDVDGVTSSVLRLSLVPLPVSLLSPFSGDRTCETQPLLGRLGS